MFLSTSFCCLIGFRTKATWPCLQASRTNTGPFLNNTRHADVRRVEPSRKTQKKHNANSTVAAHPRQSVNSATVGVPQVEKNQRLSLVGDKTTQFTYCHLTPAHALQQKTRSERAQQKYPLTCCSLLPSRSLFRLPLPPAASALTKQRAQLTTSALWSSFDQLHLEFKARPGITARRVQIDVHNGPLCRLVAIADPQTRRSTVVSFITGTCGQVLLQVVPRPEGLSQGDEMASLKLDGRACRSDTTFLQQLKS